MDQFNLNNYTHETFQHIVLVEDRIEEISFQNCKFSQCKFTGTHFRNVQFTDCDFESCDLSLAKFPGCKFSEVSFTDCKLAGINWTELNWPLVRLVSPIYFYSSNISHSTFFGLDLPDLIVEDCKAHDVDFREAKLNHASFIGTDLNKTLFMHSSLKNTNFTNAINYTIDIAHNIITKARFSLPEAMSLLASLDILIDS